jgi:hypothetical protein
VAEITGVSAADLERLAHLYGRARAPFIRLGEGMSRSHQGGQAIRAVALLPGVVGAYDKLGGGALLMTAASFGIDSSALRRPSGPARTRLVNHSRLGEALLTLSDPPIRALFVACNNPAVTCPDASAVRRGLQREDLFTVVHDPFVSDTARYADILLPAATYLETEDVHRAYGTYYLQFANQVVEPQGEAWPNQTLARELARRLGVRDPIFSMGTDELIRTLFQGASGPAATVDPGVVRSVGPLKLAPEPGRQAFPRRRAGWSSTRSTSRPRDCRPCRTGWTTLPESRPRGTGRCVCSPRPAITRATPRSPVWPRSAGGRARPSACCTRTTRPRATCATATPWNSITTAAPSRFDCA